MLFRLNKYILFTLTTLLLAAFFVVDINKTNAAFDPAVTYAKPINGQLSADEWNNLKLDFLNTWGNTTAKGGIGIGINPRPVDFNGLLASSTITTFGGFIGSLNATNISAGNFGANYSGGGGIWGFPYGKLGVSYSATEMQLGTATFAVKGNVGIGTVNATTPLQFKNNSWISSLNSVGTGVVNMFKVNASNQIEVGAPLNIGSFEFSPDSGLVSFVDMPVSASPAVGSLQGYAFRIDGNNLMTLYSEANGLGGIKNPRVGIGTMMPSGIMHLYEPAQANHIFFQRGNQVGGSDIGLFRFVNSSNTKDLAQILGSADTQADSGYLAFRTSPTAGAITERLRINSAGNIGIGTTTPIYKLDVAGEGSFNGNAIHGVGAPATGTDAANRNYVDTAIEYVSSSTEASSLWKSIGNNISNKNSGNIGIGTTNPGYKLDVRGDVVIGSGADSSGLKLRMLDGTTVLRVFDPTNVGNVNSINFGAVGAGGDLRAHGSNILFLSQLGVEYMRINSSGNLAVGTNNPFSSAKLQIKTGTDKNLAIQSGTTDSNAIKINAFNDAGNSNIPLEINGSYLMLKTGESTKMTILNGGYVGIGTTTPTSKLSVVGDGNFSGNQIHGVSAPATGTDAANMNYVNSVALDIIATTSAINYWQASGNNISNKNSGNVGIGTTVPGEYKLNVAGDVIFNSSNLGFYLRGNTSSDPAMYFSRYPGNNLTLGAKIQYVMRSASSQESGSISFHTNADTAVGASLAERMRINYDGNVGIGTTNPGAKLDVAGDGNFTGMINGKNASIDGNYFSTSGNEATFHNKFLTAAGSYALKQSQLGDTVLNSASGRNLYFGINNSPQMILVGSTGNVGIGTSSPSYKLSVAGDGDFAGNWIHRVSAPATGTDAANRNYVDTVVSDVSSSTSFWKAIGNNITNKNLGNIGIGTNYPSQKLSVSGNGLFSGTAARIDVGNQDGDGDAHFGASGIGGAQNGGQDYGAYMAYNAYRETNGNWYHSRPGPGVLQGAARFTVSNTSAIGINGFRWDTSPNNGVSPVSWKNLMTLTNEGRLGIGTTDPNSALNIIDGTVSELRFNSGASSITPALAVGNLNSGGKFAALIAGTSGAGFYYDDTGSFTITSAPKASYTGNSMGASGTARLSINTSGDINIGNGALFAKYAGNVGIGTTSPSYKLSVAGDGDFAGNFIHRVSVPATGTDAVNRNYVDTVVSDVSSSTSFWKAIGNNITNKNSGNVGIGTTNPTSPLTIQQTDNSNGFRLIGYDDPTTIFSFFIGSGGSNNPRFQSTKSMVFEASSNIYLRGAGGVYINDSNNKNIYLASGGGDVVFPGSGIWKASGNVGIGTTSPTYKLSVAGEGDFSGNFIHRVSAPATGTDAANRDYVDTVVSDVSSSTSFWKAIGNNITNKNSGNVGIGTVLPDEKLTISSTEVSGEFSALSLRHSLTGAGDNVAIKFWPAGGWTGMSLPGKIVATAPNGNNIGFNIVTNNNGVANSAISILPSGKVGIGTTNPVQNFQVNGNIYAVGGVIYVENNYGLRNSSTDNGVYPHNTNGVVIRGNGSEIARFAQNGNVGIGTTSPAYKFSVAGDGDFAGNWIHRVASPATGTDAANRNYVDTVASDVASSTSFWKASGNNITNKNSGNVGVGVATPGAKLDVSGVIRTNNQFISTVADGTAPLVVSSKTLIPNLNAQYLDGYRGRYNILPFSYDGTMHYYWNKVARLDSAYSHINITAYSLANMDGNGGMAVNNITVTLRGANDNVRITNLPIVTNRVAGGKNIFVAIDSNRDIWLYSEINWAPQFYFVVNNATSATIYNTNTYQEAQPAITIVADNESKLINYASGNELSSEVIGLTNLNNKNYGIGTTNPKNSLDITGYNTDVFDGFGVYNSAPYISANTGEARMVLGRTEGIYNHVMGAIGSKPLSPGSSRDGVLNFYTRNNFVVTSQMTILNNGFVGIGTSSPIYALDVKGVGSFNLNQLHGVSAPATGTDAANMNYVNSVAEDISSSTDSLNFWKANGNNIYNKNTQNVGIGTSNPQFKSDVNLGVVNYNSNIGYNVFADASVNVGYAGYNLQLNNSSGNTSGYLRLARTPVTAYLGMEIASQSRDGIRFLTHATTPVEVMRIMAGGNVGIGTSNPMSKLQVGSGADVLGSAFSVVGGDLTIDNGGTAVDRMLYFRYMSSVATIQSDKALRFNTGNTEAVRILSNGNVGIGTVTPIFALDVKGAGSFNLNQLHGVSAPATGTDAANKFYVDSVAADMTSTSILWQVNGNNIFNKNLGNVGVGISNPTFKLEAAGTFKASASSSSIILNADGDVLIGI